MSDNTKTWFRLNGGQVAVNLTTVALIALVAMWFKSAISAELDNYVSHREWAVRNAVVDDRFDKLEKYVQEGRVERMVFQKEVLERLTRIEERLNSHIETAKGAKP